MQRESNADITLISRKDIQTNVVFNVNGQLEETLLNVADYFCRAVQNVFEKGEVRFYEYLKEKISVVADIYDIEKHKGWRNYYGPKNPLTAENKISPQLH